MSSPTMMPMSLEEIAQAVQGRLIAGTAAIDTPVATSTFTDSRQIVEGSIEREGQVQSVDVTPKSVESNGEKVGQLGIKAPMNTGFMDKIIGGTRQAFSGSLEIFKALGSITGYMQRKRPEDCRDQASWNSIRISYSWNQTVL